MSRIFLIVLVAGLVVLGTVVVLLGAFPPDPRERQIEKVLPNDRFQR